MHVGRVGGRHRTGDIWHWKAKMVQIKLKILSFILKEIEKPLECFKQMNKTINFFCNNPSDFRRENKLKRGKPVDQVKE